MPAFTAYRDVFSVVPGAARPRQPKNLVFASQVKPDIRISDAINDDIEILENADQVLVCDRPIGSDGLCGRQSLAGTGTWPWRTLPSST